MVGCIGDGMGIGWGVFIGGCMGEGGYKGEGMETTPGEGAMPCGTRGGVIACEVVCEVKEGEVNDGVKGLVSSSRFRGDGCEYWF